MRVVVDTNLLISGLFWRGNPGQVYEAAVVGEFTLLTTQVLIAEFDRVLHYTKFEPRLTALGQTAEQLTEALRNLAEAVEAADIPPGAVRDPKDIPVLACALGGTAEFIVSRDQNLL